MSLSALKEAIIEEAQKQAEQIASEAAVHTKELKQSSQTTLRSLEESIVEKAERDGANIARTIHQQAELAGRAAILSAKHEELDATKQAFVESLLAYDKKEAKDLHEQLLGMIPKKKSGIIVAGEHSAAMMRDLKHTDYKVAEETIPNEGGFIFREKNMEINFTFSHLAELVFSKYRADIAAALFS